jgi:hypothetical protein
MKPSHMNQELRKQVTALAFGGDWGRLMPLLRTHPELANFASPTKGYTPLHQAAWHGAPPTIVGELLALGADRGQVTQNKAQTPQEIAAAKHPKREDLQYLLGTERRTLGQLMRKVAAAPDTFKSYDGNQTILDRLVSIFDSVPCPTSDEEIEKRLAAAFLAVTGVVLSGAHKKAEFVHDFGVEDFKLAADLSFWKKRFLPALGECRSWARLLPIEKEWCTVSDLFDPAPAQWGLRGDLFLWIEMRQALCHVELPGRPQALAQIISAAFASLTGTVLTRTGQISVNRFSRGGMSSGFVCCMFWSQDFIPSLERRLQWLRESWAR